FLISARIAFAVIATVIPFAPAIVVPVGTTPMLGIPLSLAETFPISLAIIAVLISPLDVHHCLCSRKRSGRSQQRNSHKHSSHQFLYLSPSCKPCSSFRGVNAF